MAIWNFLDVIKGGLLSFRLLVLVVIYIVGGIIINKFVRKPEDGTLVPNKEFWKGLPGYVKVIFGLSFNKGWTQVQLK